jgi:CRP/FNR family cyclic AMP-dependent transcriptional regulator
MKETDYLVSNLKIIDDLKKMPVFEPFTQEELTMLLNMSKLRMYSSGETIIQEGNIDRWVYFLISGKVKISQKGETVSMLNRAGDIFGEMRFIDNAPRSAAATAEGKAVCIAVDSDYVDKISGKDKVAFGYILYRVISEILVDRLRVATKELMELKGKKSISFWKK